MTPPSIATADVLSLGLQPTAQAPAVTKGRSKVFFVSGPVDFLLMGGASILTWLAFKFFHSGGREEWVIALAAQLTWICNWPHFAATSLRLYRSPATIKQYPLTAMMTPVLMAAGVGASLVWPAAFAPYLLKIYALWSPYHFSGQTVGISMVYARRAGISLGVWERRVLGAFIFATFLYPSLRAEEFLGGFQEGPVKYPAFGIPHVVVQGLELWLTVLAALWIAFLFYRSLRDKKIVHPLFVLPALTQFVWFVPGADTASFSEFVPFFHSLQYMLIALSLQLKERFDATGAKPGVSFVTKEAARWFVIVFALGAGLFYGLPRLVALSGVSVLLAITVVQAGVQLHHFFVDGIIWKLRHKSVASPLAVTIHELIGH